MQKWISIDSFKDKIKDNFLQNKQKEEDEIIKDLFVEVLRFAHKTYFLDHIYLIKPQEGPLWKQDCVDLFNAISAIFNLGYV